MKIRLVHQADDGSATWTVTAGYDALPDRVWTVEPGDALDVTFDCENIEIEKDSVEKTLTLGETNQWTLYLREDVLAFPATNYLDSGVFGLFVFFWVWLVVRLFG